jgi:uncharacterized RDD family membrane protein YckC
MISQSSIKIQLAEGVSFPLVLAGPVTRFLAWAIDQAIIVATTTICSTVLGLMSLISVDFAGAVNMIAYFVISTGYFMVLEWAHRGQTVGKRLLRLRVMDLDGYFIQFGQIVTRNLLRIIDVLPIAYLVGAVTLLLNGKNQRLGDLAANTVVVRIPTIKQPDLDQLGPIKYNSLRQYPHIEARLRQTVTPDEMALALEALLRRNDLEAEARVKTFAGFAQYFQQKTDFPPEAYENISDEQYVRNVVEIVLTPRKSARQIPAERR